MRRVIFLVGLLLSPWAVLMTVCPASLVYSASDAIYMVINFLVIYVQFCFHLFFPRVLHMCIFNWEKFRKPFCLWACLGNFPWKKCCALKRPAQFRLCSLLLKKCLCKKIRPIFLSEPEMSLGSWLWSHCQGSPGCSWSSHWVACHIPATTATGVLVSCVFWTEKEGECGNPTENM